MPKSKELISHLSETSTPGPTTSPTSELPIESASKESQPTEGKATFPQPIPFEPKFLEPKDFVSIYANHVFFAPTTLWDFRIFFGEITRVEGSNLLVENRVSVTMPLAVAKILALGIEENLRRYEKTAGKTIDLPPFVFSEAGGVQVPTSATTGTEEQK